MIQFVSISDLNYSKIRTLISRGSHFTRLLDDSLPPSWNKLLAVKKLFSKMQENDWVFWMDADSVVMQEFDPETLISYNHNLIANKDWNGMCLSNFLIRKCEWSENLIDTLLLLGDVDDPKKFGSDEPKWEQNTLKSLLNFPNIANKISYFPEYVVCNTMEPSDAKNFYIFHAGVSGLKEKYDLLKLVLK